MFPGLGLRRGFLDDIMRIKTWVKTVNIREARAHFSKLLEKVQFGEEIVIARAGTPVAKLVPIRSTLKQRTLGSARGMFSMSDDFDAPLPREIEDSFRK